MTWFFRRGRSMFGVHDRAYGSRTTCNRNTSYRDDTGGDVIRRRRPCIGPRCAGARDYDRSNTATRNRPAFGRGCDGNDARRWNAGVDRTPTRRRDGVRGDPGAVGAEPSRPERGSHTDDGARNGPRRRAVTRPNRNDRSKSIKSGRSSTEHPQGPGAAAAGTAFNGVNGTPTTEAGESSRGST